MFEGAGVCLSCAALPLQAIDISVPLVVEAKASRTLGSGALESGRINNLFSKSCTFDRLGDPICPTFIGMVNAS